MNTITQVHRIPYETKEIASYKEKLEQIANAQNVCERSAQMTYEKMQKSPEAKIQKALFPATMAVLIGSNVAATKGGASRKLAAGALGLASYALFFKSFDLAKGIINKVTKKDKENQDGLTMLGSLAGGIAIFEGASFGIRKGVKAFAQKFPNAVESFRNNAKNFDKHIAESSLGKNAKRLVLEPLKNFGKNHPKLTGFMKGHTPIIALGTYVLGNLFLSSRIEKNAQKEYEKNLSKICTEQQEAKLALLNIEENEKIYNLTHSEEFEADTKGIIEAAVNNEDINEAASQAL